MENFFILFCTYLCYVHREVFRTQNFSSYHRRKMKQFAKTIHKNEEVKKQITLQSSKKIIFVKIQKYTQLQFESYDSFECSQFSTSFDFKVYTQPPKNRSKF